MRGVLQALRGAELAFGVDQLGALLALGLGLLRHRALHLLGQVDLLHLDRAHLHAPRLGVLVDDLLELAVDLVALGEQLVELRLAAHAAQRGLRQLRGAVEVVLDRDHRLLGVQHAEVEHRVDLHRDVVARDHFLRRHVHHDLAQADLHHAVDARDDPGETRLLHAGIAAKPEHDAALVFLQDADAREEQRGENGDPDERERDHAMPSQHGAMPGSLVR